MNMKGLLRRLLLVFCGLACVAQIAVATESDSGTLTPGETWSCFNSMVTVGIGYNAGVYGTYSPTALTGGYTVTELRDVGGGAELGNFCFPIPATSQSFFQVSGFSSDPGSSWLTSITCNGVERLSSAAIYDGYSGGSATWEWGTSAFGFVDNDQVSCTIVHN